MSCSCNTISKICYFINQSQTCVSRTAPNPLPNVSSKTGISIVSFVISLSQLMNIYNYNLFIAESITTTCMEIFMSMQINSRFIIFSYQQNSSLVVSPTIHLYLYWKYDIISYLLCTTRTVLLLKFIKIFRNFKAEIPN